jgi:hypothetical protein
MRLLAYLTVIVLLTGCATNDNEIKLRMDKKPVEYSAK